MKLSESVDMNILQGQSVLLVGLGESGLACARWVAAQGGSLTVIDTRSNPPGLDALSAEGIEFCLLQQLLPDEFAFNRVVVSPGLAPSHPLMKAVVEQATLNGAPVESELDLFADALDWLKAQTGYMPKVIGITGTNGKTTTTMMVKCLAEHAGKTAQHAGNVSPAALEALRGALLKDRLPQVWALELSSFQLHWTSRLRCDSATVLNLTDDHLDWHASKQEYALDKARIFSSQTVCVLNRDDKAVMGLPVPADASIHSFGTGKPTEPAQFGMIRDGGILWLAYTDQSSVATGRRRKQEDISDIHPKLLMPVDALRVFGLHNASNALAALALCRAVGLPMAGLLHGLRSYEGEPHRVQFVRNLEGVDYFDDSKGTNVGATVAALEGLARTLVLIAGGQGKGQDFSPLLGPVSQYCKSVILIGQDAPILEASFRGKVPVHRAESMQQAVALAHDLATEGDAVLLSPACASLDMYRNYIARAEAFVAALEDLAMDRGQVC